jgi:uncharacterized protein with HEPN domain/uncharacterized protein (DUF1778 family)
MNQTNKNNAYLWDMLQASQRIKNFSQNVSPEDYQQNILLQSAVERQLEILGEAARRISLEFQQQYPNIPYSTVTSRNITDNKKQKVHHSTVQYRKMEIRAMKITKSERLSLRLDEITKRKIEQAAAVTQSSLNSFILTTVLAKADEIIRQHETMILSERDQDIFFNALLNPPIKYASQDIKRKFAQVFVICPSNSEEIIGFYSLSASAIKISSLPSEIAKKLPKYPVPVSLLGRLAVDKNYQKKGIGGLLLADAIKRVIKASEIIAIYALVVSAKNETAKTFYTHYGFIELLDQNKSLFLPLKTAVNL